MTKGLKGSLIVIGIIVAIIAAFTVWYLVDPYSREQESERNSINTEISIAIEALNAGLRNLREYRDYNAAMENRDSAAYWIRKVQSRKLSAEQQRRVQNQLLPMLQDLDNRLGL
jgi:hypothetical protein